MNKLTTSALALLLSAGAAHAQAQTAPAAKQPAPTPPTATAPTAAAPTAQRPTLPLPGATGGTVARGSASSQVEAKQIAEAKQREKQAACTAKGPAYRFKPAHVVGDANPRGGFYTSNYGGGCTLISAKEGMALGIFSVNPSARPQ